MTEPQERIGQAIDSLNNCTYGLINMPNLPDKIHVEGLRGSPPDIIKEMKEAFIEITGENPWEQRTGEAVQPIANKQPKGTT